MQGFFDICSMLIKNRLEREAKVWLKRKNTADEIIRVIPAVEDYGRVTAYHLYSAFGLPDDYWGDVLFDAEGYWIYDGECLNVDEQEQVARFIMGYGERI